MRPSLLAASAAVAVLTLAACGSDSKSDSASDSTAAVAADSTAAAGDTLDTSTGDTSTGDSTADSEPAVTFSGEGGEAFCALAKQFDSLDTPTDGDPASIETAWSALVSAMDDMVDEAPDEIHDAAAGTRDGFVKLRDLYKKYDWDAQKLSAAASTDPDVQAAFSDTSMQGDSDTLTSYVEQVCGIDTSD